MRISDWSSDVCSSDLLGVAQLLVDEEQPDVSHLPSYFAYGKYNLLGKFIGSRGFIRLEGRYLRYRTLDISKCFYNVYRSEERRVGTECVDLGGRRLIKKKKHNITTRSQKRHTE